MSKKVYLVGAGVGDIELLTVKAKEVLKKAEVLVYDQLANKKILEDVPHDCEKIFVGKMANNHTLTQDEINDLIVEKARDKMVVRLKGGDPYVFGRGGEEGEVLREHNISFEVVPGITSAIGGLCYAGIPITHRDDASDFHVYTGHFKDDERDFDFETISRIKGTIVFLMGVKNIKKIMEGLLEKGKDPNTPVAIIRKASYPEQETYITTLCEMENTKNKYNIKPPSLLVMGDVVKRRSSLNFFEEKELFRRNIVVTRARAQSSRLVSELTRLGANVLEMPVIKIKELPSKEFDEEVRNIREYHYIILTSENGVHIFFNKVKELGYDSRVFYNIKFVAIGSKTASAIRKYGINPDIMPNEYVAESLVEALKSELTSEDKILIPRSKKARPYIVDELSKIAHVKEIHTYDTALETNNEIEHFKSLLEEGKAIDVTFTSSSTVDHFMTILNKNNIDIKDKSVSIYSIGPITTKTVDKYGLKVKKQATEYTIDGLIDVLK